MSYVSEQLEHLKKLNSNEPEFIQAATEVLTTLEPVIEANPQYEAAGYLGASHRSGAPDHVPRAVGRR